jgi:hypothetical protein
MAQEAATDLELRLAQASNDLTRRFPLIVETLAPARALLLHRRRSCRL